MLACLCPLKAAAEESLNTLHFASMALRIKSTPVIMMDPQVGLPQPVTGCLPGNAGGPCLESLCSASRILQGGLRVSWASIVQPDSL